MATLHERFQSWTSPEIVSWIGSAQENQHLDFKLLEKPDMGKDDRRHLAKSISGFANAAGGVVVWGVDARRDKTDEYIDQVVAAPGVANARLLLALLNELTSVATAPAVNGVEHRIIVGHGGAPDFVATFVPAGEGGPYMAMLDEARHRYYRRIGSAFTPMDHSLVADMFGRRPHAALELKLYQLGGDVSIGAELTNTGRGIAVAPYLLFYDVRRPFQVTQYKSTLDPNTLPLPLPRTPPSSGDADGFVGGMNHVLHPGLLMRFRALQMPPTLSTGPMASHCHARFRYGAVGVPERQGHLVFDFASRRFESIEGAIGIPP